MIYSRKLTGTLNQKMGKDSKGKPFRTFAKDEGFKKNRLTYGVDNLFRYEEHFQVPGAALAHFDDIPFLNGGLFECLDRTDPKTKKKIYVDGFSRNKRKRPHVPNHLFFADEQIVDLSDVYKERTRRNEKVRGLLRILNSYKFTIVENTPIDQEIALDPELLGKVFENLLASYNPETEQTARKQTGSFYTPRPIVEYMVDRSLMAHLTTALTESGMSEGKARDGLEILFAWTEQPHQFTDRQVDRLLDAIHTCKILDPACGSGAFPMGMLQKLVYIIHKLDPNNVKWKQLQIDKASEIPDSLAREAAIKAIEQDFADNEDDYGRKLYLIENCLYGVDIQPIAIQISKLRFFISLVCDQKTNRRKKDNMGIRPLPNLETKFVAADTLISLKKDPQRQLFESDKVRTLEVELQRVRHDHFAATTRQKKLALQKRDREIRDDLAKELEQTALYDQTAARKLADWDPYDPQASARYFEPLWMFDQSLIEGFDIVIGNPPYVFGGNRGISANAKQRYKELYVSGTGKINLFTIFIERGSQLLTANGVLSYILPNTLLRVTSYSNFRKFMLATLQIEEILDLDVGVFAEVTASTIAIRLRQKKPSTNCLATVKHGLDDDKPQRLKQSDWIKHGNIIDIFSSQEDRDILEALEAGCEPLGTLCHRIRFGVVISRNFEEVVGHIQKSPKWKPFLEGNEIGAYSLNYSGRFLHYEPSLLHRARTTDIFECRKIMIQRITGGHTPLKAVLDECSYYNKESILNIILKPEYATHYEFILAVLNSAVANWYYRKRFTNDSKLTVNLSKEYVGRIPIKLPSSDVVEIFAKLVQVTMSAKAFEDHMRTHFFEDLIDACVMECYFPEHMAERDLLFLDELAPHLDAYDPGANKSRQRECVERMHRTLNASDSTIRNRLLRICADSPELLAVIKQEGLA